MLLDRGAHINMPDKVSGVITLFARTMQHVHRIPVVNDDMCQESCLVHTSDIVLFLLQGKYTWGDAHTL